MKNFIEDTFDIALISEMKLDNSFGGGLCLYVMRPSN